MKKIPKVQKFKAFHGGHWALMFVALTGALFLAQKNMGDFNASVIPTKTAAPYDGTTLPLLKTVNWVKLSSKEWSLSYDEIPADKMQPLPLYDAQVLQTSTAKLSWKDEKDIAIRNSKITYSTPYMGDYQLDGLEYAGSHLAIDIKTPVNTPVYVIGNGVVVKTADQPSGFGKHIVVRHDNFPSYENPNDKVTLYSSYNHLNQILVAEGDVVTKGQLIAKSGSTGTASTPHLHFQIDNDKAPWHPYWPFTYKEASDAGLSFFEAINAGLGKDKALETTINPMLYVQKYAKGGSSTSSVNTSPASVTPAPTSSVDELPPVNNEDVSSHSADTEDQAEVPKIDNEDSHTENADISHQEEVSNIQPEPAVEATAFDLEHDKNFVVDKPLNFTIKAVDEDGNVAVTYKPDQAVYVQVLSGGAEVPKAISKESFIDGKAQFEVFPTAAIGLQIKATDNTITGESDIMQSALFSDLREDNFSYDAVRFLKDHGVISGYEDGTFRPDQVVTRAEALKLIAKTLAINTTSSGKLPFHDVSEHDWHWPFVMAAYERRIVGGYEDGTFKPAQTVNKAEFLKMLMIAAKEKVPSEVKSVPFDDVAISDWYAPYAFVASDKNILPLKSSAFDGDKGMTRAETAATLYRLVLSQLNNKYRYEDSLRVSKSKARNFFGE